MKGKNVLITGGAGFIGSHIAETLAPENEVRVLDNMATSGKQSSEFVKKTEAEFIDGSINDIPLLKKLMKDIDYVFHQAAIPSVSRSVKDPIATNEANATGTLNLLIVARDSGVKKVVFASSSSVYGDTPKLPKIETMQPNPKSPYAVSKLAGEHYCRVFHEIYGLQTTCLRYFNVYGPRQNPDSQYSAVIPRFIYGAMQNKDLVIFGDGEQTRDFTYVKDVVEANILAAESKASGEFNIAFGSRISIKDLAEKIINLTDSKSSILHKEPRAGDVKHSLADVSKAKKAFSYSPKYSIDNGLSDYLGWLK